MGKAHSGPLYILGLTAFAEEGTMIRSSPPGLPVQQSGGWRTEVKGCAGDTCRWPLGWTVCRVLSPPMPQHGRRFHI